MDRRWSALAGPGLLLALVALGCAADDEALFQLTDTAAGGADGAGGGRAGTDPGALLGVPNVDDDDENGMVDWHEPRFDLDDDLTSFTIPPPLLDGAVPSDLVELELTGDAEAVRLWAAGEPILGASLTEQPPALRHVLGADEAAAPLAVEFGDFRREATLSMRRYDAAARELAAGTMALRSAPLIIHHHGQVTERLYAVRHSGNESMLAELADALGPAFVPIDSVDPWIQDELQWAAVTAPGTRLDIAMDSIRDREIDGFVKSLKAPDRQPLTWGDGEPATTEDKFGNLEVTPPHRAHGIDYPYGRIYFGADDEIGPTAALTSFLDEQQVQAPLRLDVRWLCVGHVDEFMTFVPTASGSQGFVLLFADVDAAYAVLEGAPASTPIPRYGYAHGYDTIGAIVADDGLRALNEEIQADYLDPIRAQLVAELALEPTDVIPVPALFERLSFCSYANHPLEAAALIPALVNLAVITPPEGPVELIVPDPFLRTGATPQADDPLVRAFSGLLPTDVSARFVDGWYPYHIGGGEVHCGTSVARAPAAVPTSSLTPYRTGEDLSAARPRAEESSPFGGAALRGPSTTPGVPGLPAPLRTLYGTLRFADPRLHDSATAQRRLLDALASATSPELRAAVVEALPSTGPGWVAPLLDHYMQEPAPVVRRQLVAALRRAPLSQAGRALRWGLGDEAAVVRAEAAAGAAHLPRHRLRELGLDRLLLTSLADDDEIVRYWAAHAAGVAGLGQARPLLHRLRTDPAKSVSQAAERALARLHRPAAD